ncbi:Aldo-ket-red domain-containing protein [Mycena indigotica]|uniref:Aldo-ket-red domain-containing protein n=1 Tax=Mycena indigotica TaxID=2126181 RepID=A0A8H6S9M6_9AGAR|nr:Aldo-ket-red domain-containing protein [Mycena indigotica]KAF7294863.1 Aldo-ket-red domain-containing protein [Mycena indigotica]
MPKRTFIFETTAGSPVFYLPVPISNLSDYENVEFHFRNTGGNPTFYIGPAEVALNDKDAVDYTTVIRAVTKARSEAKEFRLAEGVQVKIEDRTPHISRNKGKQREDQPTKYSAEELRAFSRGAFTTVAAYAQQYEDHRQDFAVSCQPSLPATRVLTDAENTICRELWEALLRLDRIFSGPLRDVAALQSRQDEMFEAAVKRLHGQGQEELRRRTPLRSAANQSTPSNREVVTDWIKSSAHPSSLRSRAIKENVGQTTAKRKRPTDAVEVDNSSNKRVREDSVVSTASSTVFKDGLRHKTKETFSPLGHRYLALIPQNPLPSGQILTTEERDWILNQRDLSRAPDFWRPVEWLALGARMFEVALNRADIRPLYHGVLLAAWDRKEWRWPGHETLGGDATWAEWIRGPEVSSSSVRLYLRYVRLGNSGLKVSKIILGCMTYGTPEWQSWVLGEEEGIQHIKEAYENGIQTFDTSNVYSNGASERILGKAIRQLNIPREEVVVMTKVYFVVGRAPSVTFLGGSAADPDNEGYVNQHGLSRKHIFDSVKASLERLQLDYIDLLQCHRFDYDTPIEETMQALHDVVKAGYVRYIGMSSCYAWQFHAMQNYAIQNKLTPFISMQNHYSLAYREEEREMFPTLKYFKVGSIPWSPPGRGLLTRPLSEQSKRGAVDRMIGSYHSEATTQIVQRLEEVSKKKGHSMAQIALAWVMAKDGVSAPIIGTTSLDNLKEHIAAVDITLTEEELKYLEEPYQPTKIIGHT